MKVFFLNAVCGTGSTGNLVAGQIRQLRQNRDRGLAAFGVGEAKKVQPEECFKFNTKAGYYLHNALARLTDHTGLYSRRQTRKLVRKLKRYDPDVIHLHNLHGYYVNYEILFRCLKKLDRPVIWTLHDCWAMTGHCTHFVGAGCEQWKTGCRTCPLLREYPICYTRGDVRGNYRRKKKAFTSVENLVLVSPSRWLGDLAQASFLGKYPVRVIPNGIDTEVFRPRESRIRQQPGLEGKKILLGVANVWSGKKGLEDFYRLAQMLPEEYQILLIGLNEQQIRELPDGIIGICRTESPQVLAEYYSAAHVFVNPTYEDTYPTVNLEAQACGTPVVSYDVCGCPETIQPGCGQTVPCGDLQELHRAVLAWCGRETPIPVDRERLCQEYCYRTYMDLYTQICEKSSQEKRDTKRE